MIKAAVLTGFESGEFGNEASIFSDYSVEYSLQIKSTNLITLPNIVTVIIVCSEAMLNTIVADANYLVLSSEEITNEIA